MKKLVVFLALVLVVGGIIGFLPAQASAEPQVTLTQQIFPPDCYDLVSNVTGTDDYIATFDCQDRRLDGSALH